MAWEYITLSTNVGTGSKVAVDEVVDGANTLCYQAIQLVTGADGSAKTLVTGSNGLPITDAGGSLTVDGTVAATQSGTWNIGTVTAVTGITNVVQVADNGSTLSIDDGGGSITVDGTVTIQDGGSTISIDDGAGSITVDGTVSVSGTVTVDSELPSAAALADNTANPTTTSVGTFPHVYDGATWDRWTGAVSQSGTWNIGTVTTVTGVTTVSTVTTVGTITNVVHVDDNGGSLTVDGTVAVTNGGTFVVQENGAALTALQLIDDTVKTLGTDTYTEATSKGLVVGAVRRDADTTLVDTTNEFGPLQMDANGRLKVEAFSGETLPVSLASVPSHAVTNAGTFAVQVDGAALTSLQLADDVIFADDDTFTPGTSKVSAVGCLADETATDSVNEGDIGIPRMTLDRKQHVVAVQSTSEMRNGGTAVTPAFGVIDAASSGDNTLLSAQGSGNKIRVLSLFLVSAGTVNVRFESGAGGTALTGQMNLVANTGFVLPYNPLGWFETAANALLNLELSGAISVDGAFTYVVVQ